jgi:hypothetical protein
MMIMPTSAECSKSTAAQRGHKLIHCDTRLLAVVVHAAEVDKVVWNVVLVITARRSCLATI